MRLLVDANESPRIAAQLVRAAHDAIRVADVGLLSASDVEITAYELAEGAVVTISRRRLRVRRLPIV